VKLQSTWESLAPPEDLLARDSAEFRRQAMKTAGLLREFAKAQTAGGDARDPMTKELNRRLASALDGVLGAGTFPTLGLLEAEDVAHRKELRATQVEEEKAAEAEKVNTRKEAAAAARSRNPRREEVPA
jgi:hypothetical protein